MASIRFIILLLLYTTALSLPIDRQQVLQSVKCDGVDLYTPDWFLRNTLPRYRREIHGKALFYTKGASKYAQQLACESADYVSLWQICKSTQFSGRSLVASAYAGLAGPEWLYDDKDSPDNPLRCIHSDHEMTKTFYENMSKAYARMARKHATVMHMSSDYANPPQDGIWGRIELPALRHQTDITEVRIRNFVTSCILADMRSR